MKHKQLLIVLAALLVGSVIAVSIVLPRPHAPDNRAATPVVDNKQSPPAKDPPKAVQVTDELPPVPAEAQEDYLNASEVIEMLMKHPKKAAGSGEWDVAIDRLTKAQKNAPTAPQILQYLGLAHQLRGRNLAAIAWLNAAYCAIHKLNPQSPQKDEIRKRVITLQRQVDNEIDLLLVFAKAEIPYIHTKRFPGGVQDVEIHSAAAVGRNHDIWGRTFKIRFNLMSLNTYQGLSQ